MYWIPVFHALLIYYLSYRRMAKVSAKMNFLRLSKHMINLSNVSAITKKGERHTIFGRKISEKYKIYLNSNSYFGFAFFGSGFLESETNHIIVCSKEEPEDFQIVKEFVTNYERKDIE